MAPSCSPPLSFFLFFFSFFFFLYRLFSRVHDCERARAQATAARFVKCHTGRTMKFTSSRWVTRLLLHLRKFVRRCFSAQCISWNFIFFFSLLQKSYTGCNNCAIAFFLLLLKKLASQLLLYTRCECISINHFFFRSKRAL